MKIPNETNELKMLISVLLMRIDALETEIASVRSEHIELRSQITTLSSENSRLSSENSRLSSENAELRSRLNLNSKNSHKPPSTDGLSKKPGLPKEPAKKSGGQHGHSGTTLRMVKVPDKVVVHHAASCPCCHKEFSKSDVTAVVQKRQVFDIPQPRMEVTEHQLGVITCCGNTLHGVFPEQVSQPAQYGSRIRALSVLLNNDYKLPLQKIEQLMGDLWGCTFNERTAVKANETMYDALQVVQQDIKENILASDLAHFDETGMRVEKKLHWFHTASTAMFTHLFVSTRRGKEAMNADDSVLRSYTNRAVHDCWAPYFNFPNCTHALCGAHLLRELTNLTENGTQWAGKMHHFILSLFKHTRQGIIGAEAKPTWLEEFENICQLAEQEEPPTTQKKRGKPKNSKGRNLLNRLKNHRDAWLAFAFVPDVPFTNNQAERDIRHLKTKQKVATNFQTLKGAKHYARIQSFSSTLRKHSMNVLENLIKALEGERVIFQCG